MRQKTRRVRFRRIGTRLASRPAASPMFVIHKAMLLNPSRRALERAGLGAFWSRHAGSISLSSSEQVTEVRIHPTFFCYLPESVSWLASRWRTHRERHCVRRPPVRMLLLHEFGHVLRPAAMELAPETSLFCRFGASLSRSHCPKKSVAGNRGGSGRARPKSRQCGRACGLDQPARQWHRKAQSFTELETAKAGLLTQLAVANISRVVST